jgi:hypothetical protein
VSRGAQSGCWKITDPAGVGVGAWGFGVGRPGCATGGRRGREDEADDAGAAGIVGEADALAANGAETATAVESIGAAEGATEDAAAGSEMAR